MCKHLCFVNLLLDEADWSINLIKSETFHHDNQPPLLLKDQVVYNTQIYEIRVTSSGVLGPLRKEKNE